MEPEAIIRKLAKTNKYQSLFALTKEAGFPLFENKTNYTSIQILFLNFLAFYYNLYTEVALNDISEIVFTDDIYEDAYMYYKRKEKVKDFTAETPKDKKDKNNGFAWVFKKTKSKQ